MANRNSKEAREKRRVKRQQVERSYKDHVPPQVRQLRQGRWFARVNPTPQTATYAGNTFECPYEGCGKSFVAPEYLRAHIEKKHYPHAVIEIADGVWARPPDGMEADGRTS
jgi:hypothetical protein